MRAISVTEKGTKKREWDVNTDVPKQSDIPKQSIGKEVKKKASRKKKSFLKKLSKKKMIYKKPKKEKQMVIRLREAPEMLEEEMKMEKMRFLGRSNI